MTDMQRQRVRFGPAGNSDSFYQEGHSATVEMPRWIYERGLDCFEYSFGRGVRMGVETAAAIREEAEKYGIQLSVHMPYFINLAVEDEEKKKKNLGYFVDSLKEAVEFCASHAVSGEAVLLSPACASWDMFPSYEVRGKEFKEFVNQL